MPISTPRTATATAPPMETVIAASQVLKSGKRVALARANEIPSRRALPPVITANNPMPMKAPMGFNIRRASVQSKRAKTAPIPTIRVVTVTAWATASRIAVAAHNHPGRIRISAASATRPTRKAVGRAVDQHFACKKRSVLLGEAA